MKTYAKIINKEIVNKAEFNDNAEIPNGWIDTTDIYCNIGDPIIDGIPYPKPSTWHTFDRGQWIFSEISKLIEHRCKQVDTLKSEKYNEYMEYNGAFWQVDSRSQSLIQFRSSYANASILDPLIDPPPDVPWSDLYKKWRDANNNDVVFETAQDFLSFSRAVSDHCSSIAAQCMAHKDVLRAMINNDPSYEDIINYNITIGW